MFMLDKELGDTLFMTKSNILIDGLSEYRVLMYDDSTIRLFYSYPQEIAVEDSVIRIGNLQVINRNEVCNITRDSDIMHVKLKSGVDIELQLDIK